MSQFARVTSLDALREFKAALGEFAEQAGLALSEATSDVQRTIWWLQNTQVAHWQREIKKRGEKVAQAKADLNRVQIQSNDARPSAVIERKALAAAQRRFDEAEEKLRRVRKWHMVLERELMLFRAGCAQIAGAVAGDLPMAIGRMDKMISSLEAYVALAAPTDDAFPSQALPSSTPQISSQAADIPSSPAAVPAANPDSQP